MEVREEFSKRPSVGEQRGLDCGSGDLASSPDGVAHQPAALSRSLLLFSLNPIKWE